MGEPVKVLVDEGGDRLADIAAEDVGGRVRSRGNEGTEYALAGRSRGLTEHDVRRYCAS